MSANQNELISRAIAQLLQQQAQQEQQQQGPGSQMNAGQSGLQLQNPQTFQNPMSTPPSDPAGSLHALIAKYLLQQQAQQEQQQQGQVSQMNAGQSGLQLPNSRTFQNLLPAPPPDQAGSLNALVANYLRQATAPVAAPAAANFQHQVPGQQAPAYAIEPGPLSLQIISSAQKLAAINPNLAGAAIRQVLNNVGSTAAPNQQREDQLIQQAVPVPTPQIQQTQVAAAPSLKAPSNQDVLAGATGDGYAKALAESSNNASPEDWSLEQLEVHVQQLRQESKPIPPKIAILLATARRKQEKREAKKMANRKSAFSSRMRKKAQVEYMEQENQRLLRESIILDSLPDPVVAADVDGVVTFANARTGRMLQINHREIVGINIRTFVARESKEELNRMISDVVNAERSMAIQDSGSSTDAGGSENAKDSEPNAISLKAKQASGIDEDITDSDLSNKKQGLLEKHKSSFGDSSMSEEPLVKKLKSEETNSAENAKSLLRHHNTDNMMEEEDKKPSPQPRDSSSNKEKSYKTVQSSSDASPMNEKKNESTSSSESGCGDFKNSRRDSNSSSVSLSNIYETDNIPRQQVPRSLPLAPSCIIALVRTDSSKIWCELTASIRTGSITDGDFGAAVNIADIYRATTKELLMCFRPITEGPKENNAARREDADQAAFDRPKQEASKKI